MTSLWPSYPRGFHSWTMETKTLCLSHGETLRGNNARSLSHLELPLDFIFSFTSIIASTWSIISLFIYNPKPTPSSAPAMTQPCAGNYLKLYSFQNTLWDALTRNLYRSINYVLILLQALLWSHTTCQGWERWPENAEPAFPTFFFRDWHISCRWLAVRGARRANLIKGGVPRPGRTVALGRNRG